MDNLRAEINSLRNEMHNGMDSLCAEIAELRSKMDANFRWIIGIMITMWATIILGITSTILTIIFKG